MKKKISIIALIVSLPVMVGLAYKLSFHTNINQTAFDMTSWNGFWLGVIQGLTEFIPISSSGHLKVIPMIFKMGDPGSGLTAVLQLGSIFAVVYYFKDDLFDITRGSLIALKKHNYQDSYLRLLIGIILGTIPICILGLLIKLFFKETYESTRGLLGIGISSIVMSLLLWLSEKFSSKKRDFSQTTIKDCICIGCAQALAIFPGVSRSGSTLTAALFLGLKRADAARFSFLLGIPAITLAGVVELKDILEVENPNYCALIVGLISSAIFSYLSIAWMIKYLQKHNTTCFIVYRLLFGVFLLAWCYFCRN